MRAAGGATTFAVSGNVEFSRRNYDSLLDAVAELVAEGTPVRIRIIGRSTSRDGLTLRADIERRGLADAFELSSGEVSHPEFFQRFADCDFVLPLIDHSAERLQAYLESKLASSIPFAVGLGVPLVLHRDLAAAYGVEPCGIGYVDGGLAEAMRTAIASGDADRGRWQAALATTRTELLAESLGNLHEAISAVAS
jgi:glycosyltransferase involved in cell wall biosynthesis